MPAVVKWKIQSLYYLRKGKLIQIPFLLFQIRNIRDDILHAWQTTVGTKKLTFSNVFSIHIIIVSLTVDIYLFVNPQVISYYSKNVWSRKPGNARTAAAGHVMLEDRFYILLPCWVERDAEHLRSICSHCCLATDSADQTEDAFPSPSLLRYEGFVCRSFLCMRIEPQFLTANLDLDQ